METAREMERGIKNELKSYFAHLLTSIDVGSTFNARGMANDIERITRAWADASDAQAGARDKLYFWKLVIYDKQGNGREIQLDHEYAEEWEAEREAEDIAGVEFTENDEDWTLVRSGFAGHTSGAGGRKPSPVYTEYFPLTVEVADTHVTIYTQNGYEVIHWIQDEWQEDPDIAPVIAHAVVMAYAAPHSLVNLHMPHIKAQEFMDAEMRGQDEELSHE